VFPAQCIAENTLDTELKPTRRCADKTYVAEKELQRIERQLARFGPLHLKRDEEIKLVT
jgi:hypothetical protein